ncbi:hypothetical protein [Coxiella burnetii]|uniref:hypothetical protein n=1 Tax=Coxiella burnetii TaxID=777 RepID=UPI000AD1002F|nr:hypothetical protein [Coxiella burnetii]
MRSNEQKVNSYFQIEEIQGYQAVKFTVTPDKPVSEQKIPSILKEKNEEGQYFDPNGCGVITVFQTKERKCYTLGAPRMNPESLSQEYQISIGGGIRDAHISLVETLNGSIEFKTSKKHPLVRKENLGAEGIALFYSGNWKMHYLTVYQHCEVESLEELKALALEINSANLTSNHPVTKNIQFDIFNLSDVINSVTKSAKCPDGKGKHDEAGNILPQGLLASEQSKGETSKHETRIIFDDIALSFLAKTAQFHLMFQQQEKEEQEYKALGCYR